MLPRGVEEKLAGGQAKLTIFFRDPAFSQQEKLRALGERLDDHGPLLERHPIGFPHSFRPVSL